VISLDDDGGLDVVVVVGLRPFLNCFSSSSFASFLLSLPCCFRGLSDFEVGGGGWELGELVE